MSVRVVDAVTAPFVFAERTMRALQAHPHGRELVLEPMSRLAMLGMEHAADGWRVAPLTELGAELLSGDARTRTLRLLDAMTAVGETRTNPLRIRSLAIADSRSQFAAHHVATHLHGVSDRSLIGAANRVNDAIIGAQSQSSSIRGLWVGRSDVDAIGLYPEADGASELLHYLRTGELERAPAKLGVELLNVRHEVEHASAGHGHPPAIRPTDTWHEEGGAQVVATAPALRDEFLRSAAGLVVPERHRPKLDAYGSRVYQAEQALVTAMLRHAGLDPTRADDLPRITEVLQGGPAAERLRRLGDAIAERHPKVSRQRVHDALEWAGRNGGTRVRAGYDPFPNGADEMNSLLGAPRHPMDPGPGGAWIGMGR